MFIKYESISDVCFVWSICTSSGINWLISMLFSFTPAVIMNVFCKSWTSKHWILKVDTFWHSLYENSWFIKCIQSSAKNSNISTIQKMFLQKKNKPFIINSSCIVVNCIISSGGKLVADFFLTFGAFTFVLTVSRKMMSFYSIVKTFFA